jgi:hypothetical protein
MTKTITNTDSVIDSRDIIERVRELEDQLEELENTLEEARNEANKDDETNEDKTVVVKEAEEALNDFIDGDDAKELVALKALVGEASGCSSDWSYGEALIHEDYLQEYCQELVKDIGDLPKNIPSYIAIDWEKTASNLEVDYSHVDFDGAAYLIRNG